MIPNNLIGSLIKYASCYHIVCWYFLYRHHLSPDISEFISLVADVFWKEPLLKHSLKSNGSLSNRLWEKEPREMAQSLKCLPCKHEDLGSHSQQSHKSWALWFVPVTQCWEGRNRVLWTCWPDFLTESDAASEIEWHRKTPSISLHVCAHMNHTYKECLGKAWRGMSDLKTWRLGK